ncbi:MAG TPA: hypothetical protein PKO07_16730 [Pseudomonadota bacterium]|nr:hypothetical protein [Pseudomonadota bacterium]
MAKETGPTGPEDAAGSTTGGGPVPFESDDLSEEDLADIRSLLAQKPDITRTDITAQDFQSMLARLSKRS